MTMTLELVAQRVEILEKQMAALMADNTTDPTLTKKSKKDKKHNKSDTDNDTPKKKRVSGYILFGKAERDNVKAELEAATDTKVKSTEVMKRLGELWKALPDDTRDQWNAKAKEITP